MEPFSKRNAKNTGELPILNSGMLISPQNSAAQGISGQLSEISVGSEQPLHHHGPDECYYIIRGKGLMILEEEAKEVFAGAAIYIPPNKPDGIKNIGDDILEYLIANSPAFSVQYEKALWPADPA